MPFAQQKSSLDLSSPAEISEDYLRTLDFLARPQLSTTVQFRGTIPRSPVPRSSTAMAYYFLSQYFTQASFPPSDQRLSVVREGRTFEQERLSEAINAVLNGDSQETQGFDHQRRYDLNAVHRIIPSEARGFDKDKEWLLSHAEEYSGQWVALHKGRLLRAGLNAKEVFEAAHRSGVEKPFVYFIDDVSSDDLFAGW